MHPYFSDNSPSLFLGRPFIRHIFSEYPPKATKHLAQVSNSLLITSQEAKHPLAGCSFMELLRSRSFQVRCMPSISELGRQRQVGLHDFKAGCVYIMCSMRVRVTWKSCLKARQNKSRSLKKQNNLDFLAVLRN